MQTDSSGALEPWTYTMAKNITHLAQADAQTASIPTHVAMKVTPCRYIDFQGLLILYASSKRPVLLCTDERAASGLRGSELEDLKSPDSDQCRSQEAPEGGTLPSCYAVPVTKGRLVSWSMMQFIKAPE